MKKKQILLGLLGLSVSYAAYILMPPDVSEAARRMAFIFVLCAFLWATELIPLYATSLLAILLETFLLCRPGGVLNMDERGYEIFLLPLGSSTIVLFFGGFILARAMSKYKNDIWIAEKLVKVFGRRPFNILLGFMAVTALLSMWMTITATAAMLIPLVHHLVKQIKETEKLRVGLMLSIPLAATIGALGTPVATPPNAIAIAILAEHHIYLSFMSWMIIALPLVFVLIGVTSIGLFALYPSKEREWHFQFEIAEKGTLASKIVLCIGLMMIILWVSSGWHKIPAAMIAILGAGIFATTGLLNKDDFRNIDWDILILMWGGLALGEGLKISGLSQWVVSWPIFQQQGFLLVIIFSILAAVFSAFMSNTATANLILPLAMAIPGQNSLLLVLAITFSCTLALGPPISTPALAMVYSTNIVKNKDILTVGFIFSIITITIATLWIKLLEPYFKIL
ncbi:MAG: DASS family sodium-coupled anion symporter [Candidatus Omnitrophica bacterium]|nr:DASS family sodium-coupled anion symporter [Candidatus Omnitrophota bacterium]